MWGEGDAIAGAIEEADAEIVFQGFNLKRYRGLGQEKVLGCLTKIQMFCDGAKDFEAEVFELGHSMIIYRNNVAWELKQVGFLDYGMNDSVRP